MTKNRVNPPILLGLLASVAVSCTGVSSVPLESPHAVTPNTTPSAPLSVNSARTSSDGAQGGVVSRAANPAVTPSALSKTEDDPQFGVHKPSDDTRVNSGAGDAIPMDGTGHGVP